MKTLYVCQSCGYQSPKWLGQCPECLAWGTLEQEAFLPTPKRSGDNMVKGAIEKPVKLSSINFKTINRIDSGFGELNRVLGGAEKQQGFVEGQVVLLGGQPGIGKSTLALDIVFKGVSRNLGCLYASGEESASQIMLRSRRMLAENKEADKLMQQVDIFNEYSVEKILYVLEQKKYGLIVIDSIQTVYSEESSSMPGTVSQIRLCASKLVNYAKNSGAIVILIGQVTKEGELAGPKLLEHMVDTVLYLEGDSDTGLRILKAVKNRFGSANEVGIFEMTESGLCDVANYAGFFLDEDLHDEIGVCKSIVSEGNRFFVVQIQALVDATPYGLPKRVAEGISLSRLQRICAIISKYAKVDLRSSDVYVKIAGGMKFDDPVLDLAVALAILSSVRGVLIPAKLVALGELNLAGTTSKVTRRSDRCREAERLGYKKWVDQKNAPNVKELEKILNNNYRT